MKSYWLIMYLYLRKHVNSYRYLVYVFIVFKFFTSIMNNDEKLYIPIDEFFEKYNYNIQLSQIHNIK